MHVDGAAILLYRTPICTSYPLPLSLAASTCVICLSTPTSQPLTPLSPPSSLTLYLFFLNRDTESARKA